MVVAEGRGCTAAVSPSIPAVDSFALWRGGLVMGLDDDSFLGSAERKGSLLVFNPADIGAGRIELTRPAAYLAGQPIYVTWRVEDSRFAAVPDFFHQKLHLLDEAGTVVRSIPITNTIAKAPTISKQTFLPWRRTGPTASLSWRNRRWGSLCKARLRCRSEIHRVRGASLDSTDPRTLPTSSQCSPRTGWRSLVLYLLAVLALDVLLRPAALVSLHEALSSERIPGGNIVAKFAVPLLVASERCLDAFVARHAERVAAAFEKERWILPPARHGCRRRCGSKGNSSATSIVRQSWRRTSPTCWGFSKSGDH